MSAKRTKLIIAGCLSFSLLGILLCLVGEMVAKTEAENWNRQYSCFNDRAPLSGFTLTVDRSEQTQLIQVSRDFAEKYGFNFQIEFNTPDHETFLIEMTRKDLDVTVANTGNNPDTYYVGFYNNDCIHPTVASDIGSLVNDLKNDMGQIPTGTITDVK